MPSLWDLLGESYFLASTFNLRPKTFCLNEQRGTLGSRSVGMALYKTSVPDWGVQVPPPSPSGGVVLTFLIFILSGLVTSVLLVNTSLVLTLNKG